MKPIKDFDGYYITQEGKVFCDLGRGNRDKSKRCEPYEIKPRKAKNGYLRVYMRNIVTNKRVDKYVHRLVAEHFICKHDDKANIVNHKDCNRENNSIKNLEWVTYKGNLDHAIKMGSLIRCEKTGRMISGL